MLSFDTISSSFFYSLAQMLSFTKVPTLVDVVEVRTHCSYRNTISYYGCCGFILCGDFLLSVLFAHCIGTVCKTT
jgi:hypothetical protein